MTHRDVIDVHGERPYQVRIGRGLIDEVVTFTDHRARVAVLHPPTLTAQAAEFAAVSLAEETILVELPDGEAAKTAGVVAACWERLAGHGFTRSDLLIGLGGGATTDVAGFVAATWLRGIDYMAVPTTLLGMVDAAVGGKTGINLPAGKNLVGSFYHPIAVSCDLDFLSSLPDADLRAGMAEVVKCGFISDPVILDTIESQPEACLDCRSPVLADLVRRAVTVKAQVVSQDFREYTSHGDMVGREILNYGHTLGHAIERVEGYTWRHGEAISVGMAWMAEVALMLGLLDPQTSARHGDVLRSLHLPTSYRSDRWETLREVMAVDKKARGRSLRLISLTGIGHARVLEDPPEAVLSVAFAALAE
ncbi:3-dehydroquinate synthase [Propionicicella superfundia]|uniref:3-dehydroquinate synthase n=1 Tax=Propionicicella superfundia TaxID=348582 RepID=UPI000421FA06|nr:3-dehydroquinate synthase [Propionicicella superfundia]